METLAKWSQVNNLEFQQTIVAGTPDQTDLQWGVEELRKDCDYVYSHGYRVF